MGIRSTYAPNVQEDDFDKLDPRRFILIKGARVHNLKNLSVAIPKNNFVVITGLSGSGKSSLAFDTLFAEGQRMYVESLSSYARQFLGRMEKPDVDYIRGIAPAISIEQKANTRNTRSTVGTTTEVYDYLKLLFARIGVTYSPKSGQPVRKDTVDHILDDLSKLKDGVRVQVSFPLKKHKDRTSEQELSLLLSKGFVRVISKGKTMLVEEAITLFRKQRLPRMEVVVDRLVVEAQSKEFTTRMAEAIETSFFEGEGVCVVYVGEKKKLRFSDRFERDGQAFVEPSTHLFSFNNPYGACRRCDGAGRVMAFSENLVIPDPSRSLYGGAIAPWQGKHADKWLSPMLSLCETTGFPVHRPYAELTSEERDLLWNGNRLVNGIHAFFKHLTAHSYKIQNRVMMSRYREYTRCPDCRGTRLRKDADYVKINGLSIIDLTLLPLDKVAHFFNTLSLSGADKKVGDRAVQEIRNRLDYLLQMGLDYLTLNRLTSTLSGGEYQRIKLTASLGNSLVGAIYIMDEPSVGLHPKDIARMAQALKGLRDAGNTVIVVEHEEEIMRAADQLIDIGPEAGAHGGQLVFQGSPKDFLEAPPSHTVDYLAGRATIAPPQKRRTWKSSLRLNGAAEHNLKDLHVDFPLGVLTVVTGVSGSGKSTLIRNTLAPALLSAIGLGVAAAGKHASLEGDITMLSGVEFIDQNPIGRSSRSNPISYIKAYEIIRDLFASQPLSRQRGYKASHFSFNVEGGRCEACQGEGELKIEMQFMADIFAPCEACRGLRFSKETLEVTYQGKHIADVLDMTVEEAMEFFGRHDAIRQRIAPLAEVGLGYVKLGQSSNSLSGGEAQRVKLASFLGKRHAVSKGRLFFLFDEPTTGLHFHDIRKLLHSLNALVDEGHTVVVIEHNMEIIKCADWIIDLGPEGGERGGELVFAGTPEDMVKEGKGHTAHFLRRKLP